MNKKSLIFALFIAGISVILALFVLNKQENHNMQNKIGGLLFEKSVTHGLGINKIIVKKPQLQITLSLEEGFWRVKEADNYYAGLVIINSLIKTLNESKIHAVLQSDITTEMNLTSSETTKKIEPISIQTFINDKKIDDIIIGSQKNNFHYARYADSSIPLLISGNFNLPDKIHYWLQQPLISIDIQDIETVIIQSETGQQLAFRPEIGVPFLNVKQQPTDISPLLEQFTSLNFIDVKTAENTPLKDISPLKTIVLFAESGIIYSIDIYESEGSFWTRINLSSNNLPTKLASDYIKESSFLYQNRFFKINHDIGKYLLRYSIH